MRLLLGLRWWQQLARRRRLHWIWRLIYVRNQLRRIGKVMGPCRHRRCRDMDVHLLPRKVWPRYPSLMAGILVRAPGLPLLYLQVRRKSMEFEVWCHSAFPLRISTRHLFPSVRPTTCLLLRSQRRSVGRGCSHCIVW